MPVMRGYTTKDGKRCGYYKWGESGFKYKYDLDKEQSRKLALAKVKRYGRAVEVSKHGR
jgi:hypothetical protein